MKKMSKKTKAAIFSTIALCMVVTAVFAFFIDKKLRSNVLKVAEPKTDNIYHRLVTSDELHHNVIFDTSVMRIYEGQSYQPDYNDGYVPDAVDYESKTTIPNGFFLNSYSADDGDYSEATDYGFRVTPNRVYSRRLENDVVVNDYEIGKKKNKTDFEPNETAYTQGEDSLTFFYDYQPIDYKITFDLNDDFINNAEGYPAFSKADYDEKNLVNPAGDKYNEATYNGTTYYRNVYGTYNVIKGMMFPEPEWQGGPGYIFKGWKIVSDDHYDPDTDEYTNFNYRADKDGNVSIGADVYGVNCWVKTTEDHKFTTINGHYYYRNYDKQTYDGESTPSVNIPFEDVLTEDKDSDGNPLYYKLIDDTKPDEPSNRVYSTAAVLELLANRSTGNLIVEAQWQVPDLVVTYDTTYIQTNFDNNTTQNVVTYEWDQDNLKYEIKQGSGTYKEPIFSYSAFFSAPNFTSSGTTYKYYMNSMSMESPYIQFWTLDNHLKGDVEYNTSIGDADDKYIKINFNKKRNGKVIYDGDEYEIEDAFVKQKYPVVGSTDGKTLTDDDKKAVTDYYAFMKEPVYDGDISINTTKLLKDGKITTATGVDGKVDHYELTLYGYVRPMVTIMSNREIPYNETNEEGYVYYNSNVQYDYIGDANLIGTSTESDINFKRVGFKDDFLNRYYDPRISEMQTGDRGYTQNERNYALNTDPQNTTDSEHIIVRGKEYTISTLKSRQSNTSSANYHPDAQFLGWDVYSCDNNERYGIDNKGISNMDKLPIEMQTATVKLLQGIDYMSGVMECNTTDHTNFITKNNFHEDNPNFYLERYKDHTYHVKSNSLTTKTSEKAIVLRAKWEKGDSHSNYIYIHFKTKSDNDKKEYGGDGEMYNLMLQLSATELPNCTFTKPGYDFDHWMASKSENLSNAWSVDSISDLTDEYDTTKIEVWLYPVWREESFTVKFEEGTGHGNITTNGDTEQVIPSSSGGSLNSTPYKSDDNNFKFVGWNTEEDGTGTFYRDKEIIYETDPNIDSSKTLTLHAMWTRYTITYYAGRMPVTDEEGNEVKDENGNTIYVYGTFTGEAASEEKSNQVYYTGKVPAGVFDSATYGKYIVPVMDGYAFDGWEKRRSGQSDAYEVDSDTGRLNIDIAENLDYNAKWKKISLPVYFNPNGGSGSITAQRLEAKDGAVLQLKSQEELADLRPVQGFKKVRTLKDEEGHYIDENGNIVDEADKVQIEQKLVGWMLSPDADEIFIEDGGSFTYNDILNEYKKLLNENDIELKSIVLYARWADEVKVTFDQNADGNVTVVRDTDEYASIAMPAADEIGFSNNNKVLLGWSDQPNAWEKDEDGNLTAKFYTVGETVHVSKPGKVFYAQWYYYRENFEDQVDPVKYDEKYHTIVKAQNDNVDSSIVDGAIKFNTNSGNDLRYVNVKFEKSTLNTYQYPYIIETKVKLKGGTDRAQTFALSATTATSNNAEDINNYLVKITTGKSGGSTVGTINDGEETVVGTDDWVDIKIVVTDNGDGTHTATSYINNVPYTHTFSGDLYGVNALVGRKGVNDSGYVIIDDIDVYSKESAYSVTLVPNNGTEESEKTEQVYFAPYTVPECKFTAPEGKEFYEWNTEADGSGTSYTPGQQLTDSELAGGVTLYARYDVLYTLKYDLVEEGVVGTVKDRIIPKEELDTLDKIELDDGKGLKLSGYEFKGWFTDKDSTEEEGVYEIPKEDFDKLFDENRVLTVYANWNESALKVIYHNTLTNKTEEDDLTVGDFATATQYTFKGDTTFTRDGEYLIVGWMDMNDSSKIYPPGFTIDKPTKKLDVKAVWGKKSTQLSTTGNWTLGDTSILTKKSITGGTQISNTSLSGGGSARGAYLDFAKLYSNWNDIKKAYTFEANIQLNNSKSTGQNRQITFYLDNITDDSLQSNASSGNKLASTNSVFGLTGNGSVIDGYQYINATNETVNITIANDTTINIKAIVDGAKVKYYFTYKGNTIQLQKETGENIVKGLWLTLCKGNTSTSPYYIKVTDTYIYAPEAPTLTYNSNATDTYAPGTSTIKTDTDPESANGDITLPDASTIFDRPGYEFVGWSTDPNTSADDFVADGVKNFKAGDTFSTTDQSTLYAIWKRLNVYVVTFNKDGGTIGNIANIGATPTATQLANPDIVSLGDAAYGTEVEYTLPAYDNSSYTKGNSDFMYWLDESNNSQYGVGTPVTLTKDTTFKAVYAPHRQVYFWYDESNYNPGNVNTANNTVLYAGTKPSIKATKSYTKPPESYGEFIGWELKLSRNGTTDYESEKDITINKDTGELSKAVNLGNLYFVAKYQKNERTLNLIDSITGSKSTKQVEESGVAGSGNYVYTVDASEFTKPGYKFWSLSTQLNGAGTAYTNGQDITVTEGMTLYVNWMEVDSSNSLNVGVTSGTNGVNESINGGVVTYSNTRSNANRRLSIPISDVPDNYTIEFDLMLNSGNGDNNQTSNLTQFVLSTNGETWNGAANGGSYTPGNYVMYLNASANTRSVTDYTINEERTKNIGTTTLHYKIVSSTSANTATITIGNDEPFTISTKAGNKVPNAFLLVLGKGGTTAISNLEIYENVPDDVVNLYAETWSEGDDISAIEVKPYYIYGNSYTAPECTFTKTGSTFDKWTDGTNTYAVGDTIPSSTDKLMATWVSAYTIKFTEGGFSDIAKVSTSTDIVELPYYNTAGFYGWKTENNGILLPGEYTFKDLVKYDQNKDNNITLTPAVISSKMEKDLTSVTDTTGKAWVSGDTNLNQNYSNVKAWYYNKNTTTATALRYRFKEDDSNILNDNVSYYVVDLTAYMGVPRQNASSRVPNTIYIGADATGDKSIFAIDSELNTNPNNITSSTTLIETNIIVKNASSNNTFTISNGGNATTVRNTPEEVTIKLIVDTEAENVYYYITYKGSVVAKGIVKGLDVKNLAGVYTKLPGYAMFGIKSVDVYAIESGGTVLLSYDDVEISAIDKTMAKAVEGIDIVESGSAIEAETSDTTALLETEALVSDTEATAEVISEPASDVSSDETVIDEVEPVIPEEELPKTEPEPITAQPVKKTKDDEEEDDTESIETTEEIIVEDEEETEELPPEEPETSEEDPFDVDEFISQILDETALPIEDEE